MSHRSGILDDKGLQQREKDEVADQPDCSELRRGVQAGGGAAYLIAVSQGIEIECNAARKERYSA